MATIDLAKMFGSKGITEQDIKLDATEPRDLAIMRLKLSKLSYENPNYTYKTASRKVAERDPKTNKILKDADGNNLTIHQSAKPVKPQAHWRKTAKGIGVGIYHGKTLVKLYDDPTTKKPVYMIPCSEADVLKTHDILIQFLEQGDLDDRLKELHQAAQKATQDLRDRKDPVKAAAQDAAKAAKASTK